MQPKSFLIVILQAPMKDKLFHLIDSLSNAEIKHFREMSKRRRSDGSAKYLELFEDILAGLRDPAHDATFNLTETTTVRVLRHRLFQYVLSALETFPHYRESKGGLQSLVRQIEILHSKGITGPIPALFEEGKRKGESIEDFRGLLHLYDAYEEVRFELAMKSRSATDELAQLDQEKRVIKAKEDELDEFRALRSTLFRVESATGLRPQVIQDQIESASCMIRARAHGYLSLSAELLSLQVQIHAKMLAGRNTETGPLLDRGIEVYDAHPGLCRDHLSTRHYLGLFVFNRGLLAVFFGDVALAEKLAAKLANEKSHEMLLLERLPALNLQLAVLKQDWRMADAVVAEIQSGLLVHRGKISPERRSSYLFQIVRHHLAAGNPQLALPELFQLIDLCKDEPDYRHQFAWILFLVAHYDLGNHDLVVDRIRATRAFFRKEAALTDFETKLINGLQHLAKASFSQERKPALDAFEQTWQQLSEQPEFAAKTFYFDFGRWIKAHRAGTTIYGLRGRI